MKSKFIHIFLLAVLLTSILVLPQGVFADASSPTITYPTYNSTLGQADLTVTWNSVAGASSYKFTLKDMSKYSVVIDNVSVTGTSYTIPASKFTVGSLYKVSVSAVLSSTEKMSESYFYIKKLTELSAIKITAPSDNAVLPYSDVAVSWNQVAKATSYKIMLWDISGKLVLDRSTGNTTKFKIPKASLKMAQKYRVAVIASASGSTDSKAQINFSIKGVANPTRPAVSPTPVKPPVLNKANITYPKNNTTLKKEDIYVTWTGDSHTTSYKFAMRDLTVDKLIYNGDIVKQPKFKIAGSNLTEEHKYRIAVCSTAAGYNECWVEGYFTVESSEVQNAILEIGKKMCDITWKPTKNLTGWKGRFTFTAGNTYTGIPYSQSANQINESGMSSKYGTDDFYKSYTRFDPPVTMPKYGNDCSGFVSICWGLSRNTTYTFREKLASNKTVIKVGSYNMNNPTTADLLESYKLLKPGDALLTNGHIMLFAKKDGDSFIVYEQTPSISSRDTKKYPTCRVRKWSMNSLAEDNYMPIRLNK